MPRRPAQVALVSIVLALGACTAPGTTSVPSGLSPSAPSGTPVAASSPTSSAGSVPAGTPPPEPSPDAPIAGVSCSPVATGPLAGFRSDGHRILYFDRATPPHAHIYDPATGTFEVIPPAATGSTFGVGSAVLAGPIAAGVGTDLHVLLYDGTTATTTDLGVPTDGGAKPIAIAMVALNAEIVVVDLTMDPYGGSSRPFVYDRTTGTWASVLPAGEDGMVDAVFGHIATGIAPGPDGPVRYVFDATSGSLARVSAPAGVQLLAPHAWPSDLNDDAYTGVWTERFAMASDEVGSDPAPDLAVDLLTGAVARHLTWSPYTRSRGWQAVLDPANGTTVLFGRPAGVALGTDYGQVRYADPALVLGTADGSLRGTPVWAFDPLAGRYTRLGMLPLDAGSFSGFLADGTVIATVPDPAEPPYRAIGMSLCSMPGVDVPAAAPSGPVVTDPPTDPGTD